VPLQWQDPVCGIGLGNVAGLPDYEYLDITSQAPSPPVITDAGKFSLRMTPDCDHGDNVRISPPSAASITRRAPAADGLDAGVQIQSIVPDYQIIGTGAVPFDQQVHVTCIGMGRYCPTDPRYTGPPTPSPAASS
jgi:hypothetical protein